MTSGNESWYHNPAELVNAARNTDWVHEGTIQIEGYEKVSELRRGGQGIVFKAVQTSTKRPVAIKVLLDGLFATGVQRSRFDREIELVARLRHPNIVRVYDSGETPDGRVYLVMEYVKGDALSCVFGGHDGPTVSQTDTSTAARDATTVRERLALFVKLADAVQFAHQNGVMHRDLKPSNVRVDPSGEPHILDFGLAKPLGAENAPTTSPALASLTGEFVGSLPWASPEQAEGTLQHIDSRTDVYSLGVILYEMITGRFPYDVNGPIREVLDNIISNDPTPPSQFCRHVDNELETIILKILSKDPNRRYQSAGDLSADLRRYLAGEAVEAKRDSRWYVFTKTVRRHKLSAAVTTGSLFLIIGFAVAMGLLYRRAVASETLAADRLVQAQTEFDKFAAVNEFLLGAFIPPKNATGGARALTVREGVDEAAARIDEAFPEAPEIQADLHMAMGYWYGNLGDDEESMRQHRSYVLIRRKALGPNDSRAAAHLSSMGWKAIYGGSYKEAVTYLRDALTVQRNVLPANDPALASTLLAFGLGLVHTDAATEAEPILRECVRIRRERMAPDHPFLAYAESVLGACLGAQGKFEEGEPLLVHSYEVVRTIWASDRTETKHILQGDERYPVNENARHRTLVAN
jgi:serine/threonine-protein kinase